MTQDREMKAALYVRVSTGPQVEGNSLTTQKKRLLQYALASGYSVQDIYMDAGLSGKNTDRPEFQRLLNGVEERAFEVVVVTKVDRISRSVPDLLELIEALRDHGVEFVAVDQQFDTSDPIGLLTLHVLGSFAQFERELLIERTKAGHRRRLHKRDWSCGPSPFGYKKVDGRLVEVPEEAKVVRRIFKLFLELKNRAAVARKLNAEGLRTRRGAKWHRNTVTYILKNPVYTGANVYGRFENGDTRLKDRDEWEVVPGMRKPMVSVEAFGEAQAITQGVSDGVAWQRRG